jgi:hypothetical protein
LHGGFKVWYKNLTDLAARGAGYAYLEEKDDRG